MKTKTIQHKVHPVWRATINGVPCMESDTSIGYYTHEWDVRPSSCIWVKKSSCKYIQKAKVVRL